MKKLISILLCLILILSLTACGDTDANTANTNSAETETQEIPTTTATNGTTAATNGSTTTTAPNNATIDKVADPEDGTILNTDITVRGEIKTNAPAINSGEFILEGTTMQFPFEGSALVNAGWKFSENTTAKDELLNPNSTTSLISFHLYDTDGNQVLLYEAVNNSDSEKPVLECQISSLGINTYSLNETFGDLIFPGGICLRSTAADVLAVYGTPENNSNFERVEVSEHSIRYVENKASGLCYYFNFYGSEDANGELNGYIESIRISTDY